MFTISLKQMFRSLTLICGTNDSTAQFQIFLCQCSWKTTGNRNTQSEIGFALPNGDHQKEWSDRDDHLFWMLEIILLGPSGTFQPDRMDRVAGYGLAVRLLY
jgi:hypothetical protein